MATESTTSALAYAPGRVELLGNHTDYNEGVVLGAAIDRGLTTRGSPRDDGIISISSSTMGRVEVPAAQLRPLVENRWANYVVGVAQEFAVANGGFAVEITGDLPAGC